MTDNVIPFPEVVYDAAGRRLPRRERKILADLHDLVDSGLTHHNRSHQDFAFKKEEAQMAIRSKGAKQRRASQKKAAKKATVDSEALNALAQRVKRLSRRFAQISAGRVSA